MADIFGNETPLDFLDNSIRQQDLAAVMGVTRQTVAAWLPGLITENGYVLRSVLQALAAARVSRGEAAGNGGAVAELSLKEKKLVAEIAKLELQQEKLKDKLVDRAQVEEQFAVAASILSKRLFAIGKRYGEEVAAAIEQALSECRALTEQALAVTDAESRDDE